MTTLLDVLSPHWWELITPYHRSETTEGGPVLAWSLDRSEQWVGEYSTLNTSEWPNAAAVLSLSDILESNVSPILFESESMRRDSPPRREKGTRLTASLTSGSCDRSHTPGRRREDDVNLVAHSLRAQPNDAHGEDLQTYIPVGLNWQSGGDCRLGLGPVSDAVQRAQIPAVAEGMNVRRLTPRECERLQGFPDDWTLYTDKGPQADGPRYKQLGNALNRKVGLWLGERIVRYAAKQLEGAA